MWLKPTNMKNDDLKVSSYGNTLTIKFIKKEKRKNRSSISSIEKGEWSICK